MSKKGPDPPPPPDPVAVANAQAAANKDSAKYQQQLNMVNTAGPNGTVNYATDDTAPGGYKQTTTLSPAEQAIFDKLTSAQAGALDIGNDQLGRVANALGTPLDTSGLPQLQGGGTPGGVQTAFSGGPPLQNDAGLQTNVKLSTGFDKGAQLQYGFNPGQRVQGQINTPDFRSAIDQSINAQYGQATSRLDPQWQLREEQQKQQLADQGLSEGSDAYSRAMDTFGRSRNDAYTSALNSAITGGQQEQNTLFGQQATKGQFANSAAAQQYAQNQGQAAFHNQTAGQDYSQNLGAAQFGNDATLAGANFGNTAALAGANFRNTAAGQQFGQNQAEAQFGNQGEQQRFNENQASSQLSDQARQQGLQERAFLQNEPINQLTGLLSLGQVSGPQGIAYTPSQVANTDVIGANALATQAANANYQAKMQQQSGLMGGLFSLGSAALSAGVSDRRLKRDVVQIGQVLKGVGLYLFRYLWSDALHVGVMAQELKRVRPDLVVKGADGFYRVDYAGLGMA